MTRKYRITTVQTILQSWEYEVETDRVLTVEEAADYITEHNIEGHCKDDDMVMSETVQTVEEI